MKTLTVLTGIILLAVMSGSGQVTSANDNMSYTEYKTAHEKEFSILMSTERRRVTIITESPRSQTEAFRIQQKTIREFVDPDRWREVVEYFWKTSSISERISTGYKQTFSRTDNGPWTNAKDRSITLFAATLGAPDDQYRHISSVDFDGTKADFYEVLITYYSSYCTDVGECTRTPHHKRITKWVSQDGRILKSVIESNNGKRMQHWRETTIYEYNPKDLKIEAPVK